MTTPHLDARTPALDTTQSLKRRGLLAAAAAFAAGLVAKLTETSVSAGAEGDVVLGAANFTPGLTRIACSSGTQGTALRLESLVGGGHPALVVNGSTAGAIYADMIQDPSNLVGGAAVTGVGKGFSPAVLGYHPDVGEGISGSGVRGTSVTATGVHGSSESYIGVIGDSVSGYAMVGAVPTQSIANTIAIYGQNYSKYAGPIPGAGGFGVYGISAKGHGVVGATATAGGAAVVGASNGVAGAYAGAFYGSVVVSGGFTVVGGPKSAAVPHPDGSHRRLYCMESPESWFEDFGTGRLECGRAEVTIDPDFSAITDLTDYHVFLTERDTHQHLIVKDRTTTGFAVEADPEIAALMGKRQTDLSGAFSWRVVAKRRDIAGPRLETVSIPPEPTMPPVPDMPPPTLPDLTRLKRL